MFKSLVLAAIALMAASAHAEVDQAFLALYKQTHAAADVAFEKKEVATLVSAAEAAYGVTSSGEDSRLRAHGETLIDCSVNPKPYGRADKSKCGFSASKAYGWYADPVLVITVKGYVAAEKAQSGTITAEDVTVSEVTVTKPDPTGLE